MTRRFEIIEKLKVNFIIQELVDKHTYDKYGDDAWQFFDTDALHCLLIFRRGIGKYFQVNTWHNGGIYSQRGLRTNISKIVKKKTKKNKLYLSGHVLGKAFDFVVIGMKADDVRKWAVENADLFPCKIRLEKTANGVVLTWLHFDCKQIESNPKVYLFNA